MAQLRPNRIATPGKQRYHRRRRDNVFAVMISIAIASLFILAGAFTLSPDYRERGHRSSAQTRAAEIEGQVVMVGPNDHCRKADFNNITGQISGNQKIPCPRAEDSIGYSYPANRLEGIANGFLKGQN